MNGNALTDLVYMLTHSVPWHIIPIKLKEAHLPEQTASLFDNGTLPQSDDYYRAKDVEEMNGHFLMFNYMLDTLDEELTPELIKHLHYELKTGVFEDRANGYAIGDYKKRPNMVGMYRTTLPQDVETEMNQLLKWYREQNKNMETLAEFHARYEAIHPFQDGNGRTGRMIMFRESLKNPDILPFIVLDENRSQYIDGLKQYREEQKVRKLVSLMQKEAEEYYQQCKYFMDNAFCTKDALKCLEYRDCEVL